VAIKIPPDHLLSSDLNCALSKTWRGFTFAHGTGKTGNRAVRELPRLIRNAFDRTRAGGIEDLKFANMRLG
jgi:hypothetical protein